MTAAPRPGWYPDPAGAPHSPAGSFRWWDGSDWTDHLSTSPQAPAPQPPVGQPSLGRSRWRTALALTLGLTLFLGASVAVGVMLWRDPAQPGSARAPASRSGSSDSPGQLDLHTRVATIGGASLTLPTEPYVVIQDPKRLPGLFDVLFLANAPVHPRYDTMRTWSATVLLARLAPTGGAAGLEDQGHAVLTRFAQTFFDGHPTTLKEVRGSERSVDSCAGMLMSARVHYAVGQLPSRYDTVTALFVELPDGGRVVAISSVPDDAAPGVAPQADAALATLTVN